jgi:MFS family permease
LKKILNRGAVVSLVFSRAVYSINWYNVAAVFTFVASDFGQNVSGLGILTASFYFGLGAFQIPCGIFTAKYGPEKITIYGIMISSIAVLLTTITTEFYQLVLLRCLVGIGMALFFGPGVTLIAKGFRNDAQGYGVGIFNGAFYVGTALGLFVWSILAELIGWRVAIAMSGILGIIGGIFLVLYLPKDDLHKDFVIKAADLRKILSNKWLLLLSLELFGIGSGQILINTFVIFYLEQTMKLLPAFAGIVGSISPVCAALASPVCGLLYDRTRKTRRLLFFLGAGVAAAIALVALGDIVSAIAAALIVGFCSGAFTIVYLAARDLPTASVEYETLAVSWVNCIQMFTGFWSPVTFSLLAISVGYSISWLIASVYTLLLVSVILLGRDENERHFK